MSKIKYISLGLAGALIGNSIVFVFISFFSDKYGTLADWLSAIGTCGATFTALYTIWFDHHNYVMAEKKRLHQRISDYKDIEERIKEIINELEYEVAHNASNYRISFPKNNLHDFDKAIAIISKSKFINTSDLAKYFRFINDVNNNMTDTDKVYIDDAIDILSGMYEDLKNERELIENKAGEKSL